MDSYRSLDAWKRAHELCVAVLRGADRLEQRKAWAVLDQLKRAAVSVVTNVVEGYALGTTSLFRKHLRIAFGSAAEVECLLSVGVEVGYFTAPDATEISALAGRSMATIRGLLNSRRLRVPR